jgi:hypothetical protein
MNSVKKAFLFFVFLTTSFFGLNATAQKNEKKEGKEKIKALYIAFMTEELNITELEAQKFWPLHKEYTKELSALNKLNYGELEKEESKLIVKKKYKDRFMKIIGLERSNLFFKKDKEFKHELINQLKRNHQNPRAEKN